MTTRKLILHVRPPRKAFKPGPKYALIERELTPEQQKENFVKQDDKFCAAMREAIAVGLERPGR